MTGEVAGVSFKAWHPPSTRIDRIHQLHHAAQLGRLNVEAQQNYMAPGTSAGLEKYLAHVAVTMQAL
jgi:hypothetical protein